MLKHANRPRLRLVAQTLLAVVGVLGATTTAAATASAASAAAGPCPAWDLYYVEAPLLSTWSERSVHWASKVAEAYHAGVTLRSPNGTALTWEYDAHHFTSCCSPNTSSGSLVWQNQASVRHLGAFHRSYWRRASLQARVPDAIVPSLVAWIEGYNTSNSGRAPDYQPFDVVDPMTGDVRLRSSTCADFALHLLDHAAALGVNISPLVETRKSHPVLYTSAALEPVRADDAAMQEYWDAVDHIVSAAGVSSALEAAAVLSAELASRDVAFVRTPAGADLRVNLSAPFARWGYDVVLPLRS